MSALVCFQFLILRSICRNWYTSSPIAWMFLLLSATEYAILSGAEVVAITFELRILWSKVIIHCYFYFLSLPHRTLLLSFPYYPIYDPSFQNT